MYKVVCLDERAAKKEYDVVRESDEFHSPVATFFRKADAEDYVAWRITREHAKQHRE
jgi:hypothetical protein